jgi:hypothetical protein
MRVVASVMLVVALITPDHNEPREIDVERSAITIHVDKTGWLSTFGDRHVIHAPIAHGWINESQPPAIEFQVESQLLTVLDQDLSRDTRHEVQQSASSARRDNRSRRPRMRSWDSTTTGKSWRGTSPRSKARTRSRAVRGVIGRIEYVTGQNAESSRSDRRMSGRERSAPRCVERLKGCVMLSLKSFHVFFVSPSIVLASGFSVWGLFNHYILLGVFSLGLALLLVVYGSYFVGKAENVPLE